MRTYPAAIGYQKAPRSKEGFLTLVLKVHSANKFGMYSTELGRGSLMRHFKNGLRLSAVEPKFGSALGVDHKLKLESSHQHRAISSHKQDSIVLVDAT